MRSASLLSVWHSRTLALDTYEQLLLAMGLSSGISCELGLERHLLLEQLSSTTLQALELLRRFLLLGLSRLVVSPQPSQLIAIIIIIIAIIVLAIIWCLGRRLSLFVFVLIIVVVVIIVGILMHDARALAARRTGERQRRSALGQHALALERADHCRRLHKVRDIPHDLCRAMSMITRSSSCACTKPEPIDLILVEHSRRRRGGGGARRSCIEHRRWHHEGTAATARWSASHP